MNLAIIPARAGSKRIRNKKKFCGRPIISYSIEAAKKSKLSDKIIVSTDSPEIAQISEKHGAEVTFPFHEETNILQLRCYFHMFQKSSFIFHLLKRRRDGGYRGKHWLIVINQCYVILGGIHSDYI